MHITLSFDKIVALLRSNFTQNLDIYLPAADGDRRGHGLHHPLCHLRLLHDHGRDKGRHMDRPVSGDLSSSQVAKFIYTFSRSLWKQ